MSYGNAMVPGIVNFSHVEFNYRYIQPKNKGLDGANTIGGTLSVALFEPLFLKFGAYWGSGKVLARLAPPTATTISPPSRPRWASHPAGGPPPAVHRRSEVSCMRTRNPTNSPGGFSNGAIYVAAALRFTATEAIEIQAGVTVSSADKYDSKVLDPERLLPLMPCSTWALGRLQRMPPVASVATSATAGIQPTKIRPQSQPGNDPGARSNPRFVEPARNISRQA